jgi:hypothetical protein
MKQPADTLRPLLPNWATVVITSAVVVGTLATILSLVQQNRELKAYIGSLATSPAADISPGDPVAATLVALDGISHRTDELLPEGGVVTVFTTTCPYCLETLPVWSQLAATLSSEGIPVIGVSLHDGDLTAAYRDEHHVDWPLYTLDANLGTFAQLRGVPTTILVDASGHVVESWAGALRPNDLPTIQGAVVSALLSQ